MRSRARLYRQVGLVVVAAAVLLGVNVPPAFSYVERWQHDRLINSPDYEREFGRWDTIELPADQRVNAIHAALLPTGKVLLIAGSGNKEDMFAAKALKSLLYDPATGQSRVIPVPDDMFCGGQTMLADGRLIFAGGTERYERLDGAVTNAAGTMNVRNESPNRSPVLPAGSEFVSADGKRFHTTVDTRLPPATKTVGPRGVTTVTGSSTPVFVESALTGAAGIATPAPGPPGVPDAQLPPTRYDVVGLTPAQAQDVYGNGKTFDLRKQDYQGTNKAYTFDAVTETWSQLPDMTQSRWYASLVPMPNGDVLTLSGLDQTGHILQGKNEVFQSATNTWVARPDLTRYFPTYPAVFQTAVPNRLVYTGADGGYGFAQDGKIPGMWNLTDNSFVPIPGLRDPDQIDAAGSAFLGPVQDQRMAIIGGGGTGESNLSTGRIDLLDLKSPNPTYVPGPSLPQGTRYPSIANLPDDSIFITNGSGDYRGKGASNNFTARILRPDGTLDVAGAPPGGVARDYHSEALLLPDGRVLTAGSDPLFNDVADIVPGTFEQRIEIYSPPYLFRGARPTITSAPPTMALGSTTTIPTPDAARIRSARLVKASTTTHVTTVDMRSVALGVSPGPGGVNVTVPPQPEIVTPGPYMLFLLNDQGVPSEAKMVNVPTARSAATPPARRTIRAAR